MTSPILLIAGRFLLASTLLMALYWVVWRKQSTHRAKRMYLLSMPIVAIAIALLQVEVYQPDPMVIEVEVTSAPTLSQVEERVDNLSQNFSLLEKNFFLTEKKSEAGNTLSKEAEKVMTEDTLSAPLQEEKKGWLASLSLDSILGIVYVGVVLILCIPFVVNLVQLRQLRRKVSIVNKDEENHICIFTGQVVEAPFSFYRYIFMPLSLTDTQRRVILTHERAHILHRHYLDVWMAEAVTRLLWWNPFVWWARAELRNIHEFEADADVLTSGEDVYMYQTTLIEEVMHGDVVIANGFNHSFIRRRFIEMLQSSNRHMTTLGKAGSMAWMLLIAALMCCTVGEAEVIYKETKLTNTNDNGEWHEAESKPLSEYLPDMVTNLSDESVEPLIQALSIINSIKEVSPEEYEELKKAYPAGTIPSMESINKSVREIKDSLEAQISKDIWETYFEMNKTLRKEMRDKGLDTLSSSKEPKDKVYHFNVQGNPTLIDANGNIHEYTIKGNEISEEDIEILINSTSQFTLDSMEVQGAIISALGSFFNSMFGSLIGTFTPLEKETYDSILSLFSLGEEAPSLEELNKQLELLRDSIQMMTNTFSLKPGEVYEVPMDVYVETISPVLTPESKIKNDNALHSFFYHWFGLSEDVKVRSKEEYEAILKNYPELPTYSEYTEIWTNQINEHSDMMDEALKNMDTYIRIQVEEALNEHGKFIRRDKPLEIEITYTVNNNDNRTDIVHIFKKEPYSSGVTQEVSETIHNEEKSSSNKKDEDIISPQWGLVLPKGSIRLTEYKEMAKTDDTVRKQYDQLMNCIRNAQALRNDALTNAFGKKRSRYVTVEESVKEKVRKLFQDANIEMLELGAYRLQDGTIVMEDDRLNLMPQSVNYHHGTTDRSVLLRNQAPTMERDKSPNYDAHNEQTWPVYTNVQKVTKDEYKAEPQVFRGEDCTYVVKYYAISFDFHWFYPNSKDMLVDRKTDDQYMIRYREHFPLDTYLWIHGQEGEYIRMVDVFPPLPKDVTTVDLIPGEIPFGIKLSNASPYQQYENLKVQTLNKNENIVY
ncbi:MAG: M56 family metallopeptidase [Bacteroidaceae bacterium]|nr:M56 family metallopeptidase [Bacteroidaceae bacterium]